MRLTAWPAVLLLAAAACQTRPEPTMTYPATARGDVVDDYFGTKVPDPYRWMEDLDSNAVADWVAAQNRVTFAYLETLPLRDRFKQRITELWDYPKVTVPVREGGRYFYPKNSGLQRQAPFYMRASLTSEPSLVIDPNVISRRRHAVARAVGAVAGRQAARVRAVGRRRRLARRSTSATSRPARTSATK